MERGPVCGMTVDPQRASAKAEHAGNTYYFCCKSCAEKFRAEPGKYLHAKTPISVPLQGPIIQLGGAGPTTAIGQAPVPSPSVSGKPGSTKQPSKTLVVQPVAYICAMDPEVRQDHPGPCPKCGMALEPSVPMAPATRIEYTCPMHPEIVRAEPGACPICGMALELRTTTVAEEENPELVSMTRRFWTSGLLTIPVLVLGMSDLIPGQPILRLLSMRTMGWTELLLATPVVLWGGWPFFERGWASLANRRGRLTSIASSPCSSWDLPIFVSYERGDPALLRGRVSDHCSHPARTSFGVTRAKPHLSGDPLRVRSHGQRGAAQPRASAEAGRSRVGVFCSRCSISGRPHFRPVEHPWS